VSRLWVDDLRAAPAADWVVARTSAEAIERLSATDFDELSLDHDLGGDDTTRAVVQWLCQHPDRWPAAVRVHTANPVGREWLLGMIGRHHQ
jgi:hypothetical protein